MTDIENSTRLWEAEPDAMAKALGEHARVLDTAVAANGGHLLKERGEGDSVFAVFARASDAVRAACAAQRDFTAREWPTSLPIRVRMAIHSGEATEQHGDYLGTAVNRTARLRGLAEPCEILVSATSASIVADHLPEGIGLLSLGDVRLRGLEREEEAFVVVGPGLASPSFVRRDGGDGDLLAERRVTPRERDVFAAVAERLTNAEIAERLFVSERTVESHVSSLLRKLDVANRIELSNLAGELAGPGPGLTLPPMLATAAQRSQCVGRGAERVALIDCWRRAERGETTVAVLTGEAGIGKSRLVADIAAHVHERGGVVLLGASTDGAGVPYQAFVEALSEPINATPEHVLREDLGRSLDVMASIVPAVRSRMDVVGHDGSSLEDGQAARAAIHGYLERLAGRRPVLVVLEDLHWASPSTRDVVLHVARRAGPAPLMIAATTRDVAPDLDKDLTRWLASVERLPVVTTVPVGGLDLDATSALLRDLHAAVDASEAWGQTGGNPFLLRELASAGSSGSALKDFVADRLARLPVDDVDVVETAAVIGETFSVEVLAAAVGRAPEEVLDGLERSRAAGLTEPVAGSATRNVFVHALVRDSCYATLAAGRRLQLHAAVARGLSARADDPAVLPELARHAAISAPLGGADRAIEWSRTAGVQSLQVGDLSEAAAHFERALDIVDLGEDPSALRLQLSIRLGEAVAISDKPRSLEVLRDATRQARRTGDAEAFADAVCSMTIGGGSMSPGRRNDTFVALAEEALDLLGEAAAVWRARTMALLGAHLCLSDDPERGRGLVRDAVRIARDAGDPETFVRAALSLRYSASDHDRGELWEPTVSAFEVAERHGYTGLAELAAGTLADKARAAGDLETSTRWHRRAAELTEAPSVVTAHWPAIDALLRGKLVEAERLNQETLTAVSPDLAFLYVGNTEVVIDLMRGKTHPELLDPLAHLDSFVGMATRSMRAVAHLVDGEVDAAGGLLEAERSGGLQAPALRISGSVILAQWSEVAAATGDREAAAELAPLLDPLAGSLADNGSAVWGSIDFARALLAVTVGDHDRATALAMESVHASRSRGTPILLGRELMALAWARMCGGAAVYEIADLVGEALQLAERTGARIIELDAQRWGVWHT